MTRGTSFLKAASRWISSNASRLAQVQPLGDPGGLFAGQALAIEQIDGAVELQKHTAQAFQFLGQVAAQAERRRGNPPLLPGGTTLLAAGGSG